MSLYVMEEGMSLRGGALLRGRTWAVELRRLVAGSIAVVLMTVMGVTGLRAANWMSTGTGPATVDPSIVQVSATPASVIVQARPGQTEAAAAAVERLGGTVGERLPVVDGFTARIPGNRIDAVAKVAAIRAITANGKVHFESLSYDDGTTASNFARTSGASSAWTQGFQGTGVGVAVIDTGVADMNDIHGRVVYGPDLSGEGTTIDNFGHGTVMAGIIAGSGADSAGSTSGARTGVAPKAHVVAVKVAGRNGSVDVSTVLQAMHWVAAYKDQYNIKVLNLSWGTPSTQDPAADPLNYAVERLWNLGITVVVAAGNSGPTAGTITKPGDDPMVVTAGAYDDKQNTDPSDDSMPSWSSHGPTAQGLTKPDLVAPGRSLVAMRAYGSYVEQNNPKALVSPSYIRGSGTSEATAVTSGLAALVIQAHPDYTPDQVKAVLKGSASPMANFDANSQGTGRVNLAAALTANPGPAQQQASVAGGMGKIELSRGGYHLQTDCNADGVLDTIQGEMTAQCQVWDPAAWTGTSWTGTSWTGTSWTGTSWTGTSWTGTSWTGTSWTGTSWTGGTWTGTSWTGTSWTGTSWTGTSWTGTSWTGTSWTGTSWTGTSWTSSLYEDEFLTAFWGAHPKSYQHIPGETSDPSVSASTLS